MKTLWGGRFAQKLDPLAWDLNSSLAVDKRMALQDVEGSRAWADALHQARMLSDKEHASISLGLATIREEFSSGRFTFAPSDEDIHTAVERRLTELGGGTLGRRDDHARVSGRGSICTTTRESESQERTLHEWTAAARRNAMFA